MSKIFARVRIFYIGVATIIATLIFLAFGAIYWATDGHAAGFRCVYDDPVCSLTVATWVLVLVGGLAFTAALAAARFAERTFNMESRTQLGQSPCTAEHGDRAIATIYVLETFQVLLSEPPGFDPSQYRSPPAMHDFENLGRAPIVDCRVSVIFENPEGARSSPMPVRLGNIGRDKHVHVKIFMSNKLERTITRWQSKAYHAGDYNLPFYPFDGPSEEVVLPFTV